MSGTVKKSKMSTEPRLVVNLITDLATTVESIAKSLQSVNKSHGNLLRTNKAVVALKLDIEKDKRRNLDTTVPIPQGN